MEWLDNLKEEIAWPYVQARNWWERSEDNRFAAWALIISTAVLALITYGSLFFGGRAIIRAVSSDATITVVSGNPCLNEKGLIKAWAPALCYADKLERTVKYPPAVESQPQTIRNNDATISSPNDEAYDPPCKKDGLPGCSDKIYSKRLVEGYIDTATFNDDERIVADGHLQPDYTEVKLYALQDDMVAPDPEKLCGNMLDKLTPGKKFKMVINESKQSDYNGCYTVEVVTYTFGGDKYVSRKKR